MQFARVSKLLKGPVVPCLGSTKFQVTYDGQQTNVLALVTSCLRNEVVLSWRTLQRLGVPEDYPGSQFNKANMAEVQVPGQPIKGAQNNKGTEGPGPAGPANEVNP